MAESRQNCSADRPIGIIVKLGIKLGGIGKQFGSANIFGKDATRGYAIDRV